MNKTHFQSEKNCFSSLAKANAFINQFSDDILSETGFAPVRTYYSEPCQAWQVTSKYHAPAGYIKEITSRYDQICHAQNYSRNSLKQNREHQLDALLFFIGNDILKAIKALDKGENEACWALLEAIRRHLSFAMDFDGEDSRKIKIKKFIAVFHKRLGSTQEGVSSNDEFRKFAEYFGKKRAKHISYREKGKHAGEHTAVKKKIYECYALLHNVSSSDNEEYDNEKKAMMDDAMDLFRDIAESNVCKYKRKKLKMEFINTINACAGVA